MINDTSGLIKLEEWKKSQANVQEKLKGLEKTSK
jgi:hypothetical protein